jgi:hypothetical protein
LRVAAATRLFVRWPFFRGARIRAAEHQLARSERQDNCERYSGRVRQERARSYAREEPSYGRSQDERERHPQRSRRDTRDRCGQHGFPAWREERRQEMPVEPALIGSYSTREKRNTDQRDDDLGNYPRGEGFGPVEVTKL